jgi:hypothetical protein
MTVAPCGCCTVTTRKAPRSAFRGGPRRNLADRWCYILAGNGPEWVSTYRYHSAEAAERAGLADAAGGHEHVEALDDQS